MRSSSTTTIFRTSLPLGRLVLPAVLAAGLVMSVVLITAGCSARTRYTLEYYGLAHIPPEYAAQRFDLTTNTDKYLYLLPHADLVESAEPVDITLRRGIELEYPVPPVPEGGNLQLSLEVGMAIRNRSATGVLPSVECGLYIDEPESEDIYAGNSPVFTFSSGTIGPGEGGRIEGRKYVEEGSAAWALLTSGALRAGVEVVFTADSDNNLNLEYEIDRLRLRISVLPFGYIP
ncbi:MAG: hypothetical protein U5P10_05680 [Spirochaetia bacterium]|nr:hypothetical protein [Spirochaetia bacterium]